MRHARLASLLLVAALLLGCTRQTSTQAPTASGTPASAPPAASATAGAPPAPVYVEVATGTTSNEAPGVEFPARDAPGSAPREVDGAQLPAGARRGVADPTGRYVAYLAPAPAQDLGAMQGVVKELSTGREWRVEEPAAVCDCDAPAVDAGPLWSSSGRFVAFGTGNWREPAGRHVTVVEPEAGRVIELPKAAWLPASTGGNATAWRPGYDLLAVGQADGVFLYDAAARTSTMMAAGRWPRFVGRDLVQYELGGSDDRPEWTVFVDIWRGGEVARLPWVPWASPPVVGYEDGRVTLAGRTRMDGCIGIVVAHPALPYPTLCIPGGHAPAWSPDRRLLAFSRVDGPSSRSVALFDPATGLHHPVADHLPASNEAEQYEATWSTDGRYLRLERRLTEGG